MLSSGSPGMTYLEDSEFMSIHWRAVITGSSGGLEITKIAVMMASAGKFKAM